MFITESCTLHMKQAKKNFKSDVNLVENLKLLNKCYLSQQNSLIRITDTIIEKKVKIFP